MATTVGLMHLELTVPQAGNLKDKRRIVKGFKDRLMNRFNVSVAEVSGQETHRRAGLVVAMVGNDRRYIAGALQKILNMAATHRDMILVEQNIEWL